MKTVNLVQGSPEWHAHRSARHNASEASAMMGASPHVSRSDLLRMKATGAEREIYQGLANRGHEVEALARPLAEDIIGDELFPATCTEDAGKLSASFDGITLTEDTTWECKQWNEHKAALVRAGELPVEDKWQVVQQLAISRATKCLYMVTDGTPEKCVHMWVALIPEDEKALRAGWVLFDQDLAAYTPTTAPAPVAGTAPEALPALFAQVRGEVTSSNIIAFKARATDVLAAINTDLKTDEDFASAEVTTRWCKEVEERLAGVKANVLGQTASIDELFRAIDEISEMTRGKRLLLEKVVTNRKQAIRDEILADGKTRYEVHVRGINDGLPQRVLSPSNCPAPDFAGVMKGKKFIKSLRDAVDQELAKVKLEVNALAEQVRANFKSMEVLCSGYETLFADRGQLVFKAPDDLAAVIKARVTEHKAAEELRTKPPEQPAAAPQPAPSAPAPAPAAAPARQQAPSPTLETDLAAWRKKHKVAAPAFNALLQLLAHHKAIAQEAA